MYDIVVVVVVVVVVVEPGLQDRLFGIATVLPAGRTGVRISAGVRDLSLHKTPIPAVGPCWSPTEWYRGSFGGVKRPGIKVDHPLHVG